MKTFASIVIVAVICVPCLADDTNSDSRTVGIESAQTNLKPVVGTVYVLEGPDLYKVAPETNPGPMFVELITAWGVANEFVFRTALQTQYKLPASGWGLLENGDATLSFEPKAGDRELTVLVHRENRGVEIVKECAHRNWS